MVFSWPMVHPLDDGQYILRNSGVASGKAKLKTSTATHEVTDGPLAEADAHVVLG